MPELPIVSGRDARRAFERLGWTFRRQTGSHMLSIPDHRELAPGTLRKLIRLAGVTVEQFRDAMS